jgi:hypothetical protein
MGHIAGLNPVKEIKISFPWQESKPYSWIKSVHLLSHFSFGDPILWLKNVTLQNISENYSYVEYNHWFKKCLVDEISHY